MYSHDNTEIDGTSVPIGYFALSDDESILSINSDLETDSNQSYSGEMNIKPQTALLDELRTWKSNHNINDTAVSDLINILSKHGHKNLSGLSTSTNVLSSVKRRASSPIMDSGSQNWKTPSTSDNAPITNDNISARLDTVEQKIDIHQIATQKVLANQATMQKMLNLILQKLPGDQQIPVDDLSHSQILPIRTIDMLEEYEAKLRNFPDFKNNMILLLSQFGGPDPKKTSRNIVRAMISDEVLVNFSWTGTNTKRVFSSFREINSTIITTMRKRYHDYTEYDNATFFKDYLKHASTRLCRNENKINICNNNNNNLII